MKLANFLYYGVLQGEKQPLSWGLGWRRRNLPNPWPAMSVKNMTFRATQDSSVSNYTPQALGAFSTLISSSLGFSPGFP